MAKRTTKTNPVRSGSGAKISRDSKGNIVAKKGKDFAGISQETMREDRLTRAQTGTGDFSGAPAPRVGGVKKLIKSGVPKGGTKKMMKASKKRASQTQASPQAKRSAKKLY